MIFVVLIASYSSSGNRRCDSRCYDAECAQCDCICGGVNHGVGLAKALDNTRSLAESIRDYFTNQQEAQEHNSTYIDPQAFQLSIFGWLTD